MRVGKDASIPVTTNSSGIREKSKHYKRPHFSEILACLLNSPCKESMRSEANECGQAAA